jgi:predicted  nucleic acid-binding Zn-ribbon protein
VPTLKCFICGTVYSSDVYRVTCGKPECHEKLVQKMIAEFGEFKKVVRASTGQTFKVPIRDIIEKGLREQDLDKYPLCEEV